MEGNHYFPVKDVRDGYLQRSDKHTVCPWKGSARYYTIDVDGRQNRDAAWYYPEPLKGAEMVRDRIAFWRGVEIEE